jgi:hypothetical protein
MSLIPTNLGANRKKVQFLGVLVAILIGVFIYNISSSTTPVPMTASAPFGATPAPLKPMPAIPASLPANGSRRQGARVEDFRPSLKLKEGTDVSKIDPTLRLDLLARLQNSAMKGGARSLFAFGAAPPPPVDPIAPGLMAAHIVGPVQPPPKEEVKPPEPKPVPPTPIPLKFYGYSARGGTKRAFFLDSDNEIQVAGENETVRNRYKVIRIGINSVVIEDTQSQRQQTLPLVEEMAG